MQADEPVPPRILVGLHPTVRPEDGEVEDVRFTFAVNPLTAVTLTVNELVDPELKLRVGGLALKLKSCLKKLVIAMADLSFVVSSGRFQFTSIVLVNE